MTFRRALGLGLLVLALVSFAIILSGCSILLAPDINPGCPYYSGCPVLEEVPRVP